MNDRIILHCDCNSYFASVESLLRPELKNVPMAVTGNPENRHGIILAKNELAKQYGIQTAETIWQAKKKCPDLVCVAPHRKKYEEICDQLNQIYLEYTDLVEPFSIDESYLDVTGSLHLFSMTAQELADRLRQRVRQEIGITISVGVSFCKVFAKLGSDYKKPDATTVISVDNLADIVYPLPVGDLLFVGRKSVELLHQYNIDTCGELAQCKKEFLINLLGKQGYHLWDCIHGEDREPVRSYYDKREVKSVGNSITFPQDLLGEAELRSGLMELSDSVAARLRKHKLKCATVQIQIKDPQFKTISRQKKLNSPTNLQKVIYNTSVELLKENWDMKKPVRLLSVTGADVMNESEETPVQLSLFQSPLKEEDLKQQETLEKTMDDIRNKFGKNTIGFGISGKDHKHDH